MQNRQNNDESRRRNLSILSAFSFVGSIGGALGAVQLGASGLSVGIPFLLGAIGVVPCIVVGVVVGAVVGAGLSVFVTDNIAEVPSPALENKSSTISMPVPEKKPDSMPPRGSKEWLIKHLSLLEDFVGGIIDPISLEVMTTPIVANDGNTYDREILQQYYDTCIKDNTIPRCPKNPNRRLKNPINFKECEVTCAEIKDMIAAYGSFEGCNDMIRVLRKKIDTFSESSCDDLHVFSRSHLSVAGYFKNRPIAAEGTTLDVVSRANLVH
jgi:hypothetical protein